MSPQPWDPSLPDAPTPCILLNTQNSNIGYLHAAGSQTRPPSPKGHRARAQPVDTHGEGGGADRRVEDEASQRQGSTRSLRGRRAPRRQPIAGGRDRGGSGGAGNSRRSRSLA